MGLKRCLGSAFFCTSAWLPAAVFYDSGVAKILNTGTQIACFMTQVKPLLYAHFESCFLTGFCAIRFAVLAVVATAYL